MSIWFKFVCFHLFCDFCVDLDEMVNIMQKDGKRATFGRAPCHPSQIHAAMCNPCRPCLRAAAATAHNVGNQLTRFLCFTKTCRQVHALGSKHVGRMVSTWKNFSTALMQECRSKETLPKQEQSSPGSTAHFRNFAYNSQSRLNLAKLSIE